MIAATVTLTCMQLHTVKWCMHNHTVQVVTFTY